MMGGYIGECVVSPVREEGSELELPVNVQEVQSARCMREGDAGGKLA